MPSRPLIVATGAVTALTHQLLAPYAEVVVVSSDAEEVLLQSAPQTLGFIVRGGSRLGERVITSTPGLRVIARSGIGTDGVDVAAATARRIPVVVARTGGTNAVAEGSMALMLALAKRLTDLDRMVRSGRWKDRDSIIIGDLDGAVLGIVGFGRIGQRVAEIAQAFQMCVVAADPYLPAADAERRGVELVSLPDLMARSDFVALHAPLTEETRGMINAEVLRRAKPGMVLVNLGRGGLISSLDDIQAALEAGAISAVGLDVLDPEPPCLDHPLFQDERVLFSPHALGLSRRARERIFEEMTRGIIDVLEGRPTSTVANPEVFALEPASKGDESEDSR